MGTILDEQHMEDLRAIFSSLCDQGENEVSLAKLQTLKNKVDATSTQLEPNMPALTLKFDEFVEVFRDILNSPRNSEEPVPLQALEELRVYFNALFTKEDIKNHFQSHTTEGVLPFSKIPIYAKFNIPPKRN